MSWKGQGNKTPRVLYALIFIAGISFSLLGSLLPDMSDAFQVSRSRASWLPLAQFSGNFAALMVIGLAIGRARTMLLVAGPLLAAASFSIAMLASFSFPLMASFFVFGASAGVLITLPGMVVSRLAPEDSARSMNVLYAFFSAGVMTAPAASGLFIASGLHYRSCFLLFSGLCVLASLAAFISRPRVPDLGEGFTVSVLRELAGGHTRLFIAVLAMNLCYIGSEAVPNAWIPKYLSDVFPGASPLRSSMVLSFFWMAMTAGRFVCAFLVKKLEAPAAILAGLAVLSVACLLAAPMMEGRLSSEIVFACSGFFFSGMFPIIISFTSRLPERLSGAMFIMVMAAGMMGASIAGKSVGVIADALGFRWGMGLAAGLAAMVLVFIPLLGRAGRAAER